MMRAAPPNHDRGTILPIVLVISLVLSVVVVAVAKYVATTMRQGQVVEASADRLSAADGAMDNALEDLERGSSVCALTSLSSGSGYTYSLGDNINGVEPTITCQAVGGNVNAVDAFAVIITGDGGQSGPLLTITNGGNSAQAQKTFEGPVYMAKTPRDSAPNVTMDFAATLTIEDGDLWYSNPTCPATDVDLPSQLTITPQGYGTKCLEETWQEMFAGRRPPEPAVTDAAQFPDRSSTPPTPDSLGCYVWPAGRYTSPPALAHNSYNYFESGDYYFDDVGTWAIGQAHVLAGYPGGAGPSIAGFKSNDTFSNNPCRNAWSASGSGASFYMGGTSQIFIQQNGALEISGRVHSGYNVGIQALEENGTPSTIRAGNAANEAKYLLRTESGSNKQMSIQGLVWAPYARFEFDLISNEAVAALTGGAVVAALSAGASANANNFVITVETQPSTVDFVFTTTATNRGTTRIRTVLTYRTDTEYAITSRRVRDLTPE